MGIATVDVLLMHCLEWTSHVSVHANLKVPIVETAHTDLSACHECVFFSLSLSLTHSLSLSPYIYIIYICFSPMMVMHDDDDDGGGACLYGTITVLPHYVHIVNYV